ncbi:MAG: Ig-like domain-containing protein [Candidatus Aminicenantes bacterium]|nr:Ig-like domain-containing protein [Candidatus Aminicenantes bacterium]
MKKTFLSVLIVVLVLGIGFVWGSAGISVQSMPPVVVKTMPQAGTVDVDPGLKEIRVTFSKEMKTKENWSVVIVSRETFPKITGSIHYLPDKKTVIVPVTLEPGRTYAVWLNSKKWNYFQDVNHNPAVPYLLVFETKSN